jgi:hypothetical protein
VRIKKITEYDWCKLRAEQKKMWLGQHLQCATMGTAQHKRDNGRRLFSTADSMMLMVVQVIVS